MASGIRFHNDLAFYGYIHVYNWNYSMLIFQGPVPAGGSQFVGVSGNTYGVIYQLYRHNVWEQQTESLFVAQSTVIVILFSQIFGSGGFRSGLLYSSTGIATDAKAAGDTASAVLDEESLKEYVAAGGDANDDISKFVAVLKEKNLNDVPDVKPEVPKST